MIIAIDGPAAAGKGTLARKLAEAFDFAYLDTGALYRTTALMVINSSDSRDEKAVAIEASAALDTALISDPALRLETTGAVASRVAAIPEVRANLLSFQRNFGSSPPDGKKGAVLDGRDIGTVICPDADLKFFVTASAEERARRRLLELEGRGVAANFDDILRDVHARDEADRTRKDAPLKPAEDAHLLDTTDLAIDAVFLRAEALVREKLKPQ
jgi:cytidylate kinase